MTGLMKELAPLMTKASFWLRELPGITTNHSLKLKDSSLSSAYLLSFLALILCQASSLPRIT